MVFLKFKTCIYVRPYLLVLSCSGLFYYCTFIRIVLHFMRYNFSRKTESFQVRIIVRKKKISIRRYISVCVYIKRFPLEAKCNVKRAIKCREQSFRQKYVTYISLRDLYLPPSIHSWQPIASMRYVVRFFSSQKWFLFFFLYIYKGF